VIFKLIAYLKALLRLLTYSRFQWGKDNTTIPYNPNLFNIMLIIKVDCGKIDHLKY